jgi:ubiquinone biosynthesis protein
MEVIQLACIATYEFGKYVFTRKFDIESFCTKCIRVNIVYTKFFQAIASKYNLHASVHNIPYTEDEMKIPLDITVGKVIGSGLISIVFEGVRNGQPIVVKTKRRNIDKRVTENILAIHRMIDWIDVIYPIPTIRDALLEISEVFYTQLDFRKEVNNHKRFQAMFAQKNYIVFPTLIEEECNAEQIVMTRLDGEPLATRSPEQKKLYSSHLMDLLMQGLLVDGFVHADLHVGNLMFQEKTIGVIDFGLMIELSKKEKVILADIIQAFAMQDFDNAAIYTFRLIGPDDRKKELSDDVLEDLHAFIIHNFKRAVHVHNSFRVCDVMEMNQKLRVHGLTLSPLFSKIMMALHSVESVLTELSTNPADVMLQVALTLLTK